MRSEEDRKKIPEAKVGEHDGITVQIKRIILILNCHGAGEEGLSELTLIDAPSHSPGDVPKYLHICGYHNSYHVASTGRPCLEDVGEHGEPEEDGKRDGRGETGVVREESLALITYQPW